MASIFRLIGNRFEQFLQKKYPDLKYIGDETNQMPDFEHELFFAEAKVQFDQHDFATHLKKYQIKSFKKFERIKPVLYLIGIHDFENSRERLVGLNDKEIKKLLTKEMNILRFFIVHNKIITNIWKKRNYVCKKGHIKDCTLREGHLRQIINNKTITISGKKYNARDYYNVPNNFSFSSPKEEGIGHIMPNDLKPIIRKFYK